MAAATIPKKLIQQLIFGGNATSKHSIEQDFEKQDEERGEAGANGRPSAYVEVFEGMVKTVIEYEHGLLSEQEINALEHFSKLCYNTRYSLIRLVLRKANSWQPVSGLESFKKEVGEEGLISSISDLCKPIASIIKEELSAPSVKAEPVEEDAPLKKEDGPEIIDLTMDTYDEEDIKPNVGLLTEATFANYWANKASTSQLPSAPGPATNTDPIQALLQSNPDDTNLNFFCEDETNMTLSEILWRLTKDQLMELVKKTKCKPKATNKSDIIYALQLNASTQSVLDFAPTPRRNKKGKARDDGLRQTQLTFQPVRKCLKAKNQKTNQEDRLREMALKILGKCVRVNFDFYRLVRRLHIIYYRETEHPTVLLLPSLLTTFKKRNYTPYDTIRSTDIWSSREELLGYEKALELEQTLDEIMEPPPDKSGRKKTPARVRNQFVTPVTPGPGRTGVTPLRTPGSVTHIVQSGTPATMKEEDISGPEHPCDTEELGDEVVVEVKKEEIIKTHFEEWLFPKWQEHITSRTAQEVRDRSPGLERFETGYVYTRMVYKATKVLGTLREYEGELAAIEHLLSQRFWSRGKRARFYDRRAIILGHLVKRADADDKHALLWRNMEGVKEALLDGDTGIVWRPSLVRRLLALEKRLKIPPEERSRCEGELRPAKIVELTAVRVHPLLLDSLGRPINEKENSPEVGLHAYMAVSKKEKSDDKKPDQPEPPKKKMGQKSRWEGRNGQIVDVETRALEFYEDQGFKGFHSETRILTTIFGLLFWDIIFANIPGAFETAFQSGPLDMFEDSFCYARKDLIEKRLGEIRAGCGREILERHDSMYREKKTWCLCVSWDVCNREDLVEIIECFRGESLATICTLFCQDYRGRSSGGPDLFVWNAEKRTCKFVEVKGPGDVARENQKFWFDALLRADVDVEVCKVLDKNFKPAPASSRKRKANTPGSAVRGKNAAKFKDQSEEEDYDQLDPEPEEDTDDHQPDLPSSLSPLKRQRISDPERRFPGIMDELSFASTSTAYISCSPSSQRSQKVNRAEVVLPLTPSRKRRL